MYKVRLYTDNFKSDIEKKYENITELAITNTGITNVIINGKTLASGKSLKLLNNIVAKAIEFVIQFPVPDNQNGVEFTYLQAIKDKPNCK